MTAFTQLETIIRAVVFGVRLHDVLTERAVADDLDVRLLPLPSGRPTSLLPTPSGVFAAHRVAGLHGFDEAPDPDVERPFRLEVRDRRGRFHPFAVDDVTLPTHGLFSLPYLSPPGSPPGPPSLPLFSLPARPVPPGTAVVRARLVYAQDQTPAAYAALEVVPEDGAEPVRGIADGRGEVAVLFHYPRPPALVHTRLAHSEWTIGLRGFSPAVASPAEPGGLLPQLTTFLDQFPATLIAPTSPAGVLDETTVVFGRESVLHTLLVGA